MRSSLPFLIVLTVAAGLSACARTAKLSAALRKGWRTVAGSPKVLPKPAVVLVPGNVAQTATLSLVSGVQVLRIASLPEGFTPDLSRAPLWLQNGAEVGVIGSTGGKTVMLGFGGAGFGKRRTLIEDFGIGAPSGRLLDIAARPDGAIVATAIAAASQSRLEVNLVDLSNPAAVHSIMALDGEFDAAELSWLDQRKIALAAYAAGSGAEPSTVEVPEGGLYLITFGAGNSTRHLNEIHCPLSPLAFSPNGHLAIAQGGGGAAPAVIDVSDQTCKALDLSRPIQVLGWAPDSTAFLYTAAGQSGVFGLDLTSGRSSTIAVSSAAAAYAADGTIVALGSQGLSWKRAAGPSNARVKVQIALFDKAHSQITINSLGFVTEPALLAQSTIVFSQVSNDGLIDTAMPTDAAPMRAIIEYSYPARAAFVIARGPVRGPIAMSWSPEGKRAAIVDGDGTRSTLAVIGLPK